MARIDAHQHLWNMHEVEYPWLTAELGPLYRSFEPEDLAPQLRAAGIDRTVLVQSANSYEDTAYMLRVADATDWIGAVVGWVDLMIPEEVEKRIDMYSQHPKFRGVRHLLNLETNVEWVLQPVVLESLKLLASKRQLFEFSGGFPEYLRLVSEVAKAVPDLTIVIDDLGQPPIRAGNLTPWEIQLREAAEHERVYAKLSGLPLYADWETWTSATLKPYVDVAFDAFGADRLMFGSGWPVSTLAGSYQAIWLGINDALEGRSSGEINAVLGGTASKVYRI
ncbi:MAG: amidohydrolase family protein [Chloroflexota bacterium]|nr:MAG: hypothetical protein DIU68_11115 [Chloroflexota bacterium]